MRYLLVKEKGKKQYSLYCPETYGSDTWGSSSFQTSIVKKRKSWYVECWLSGNEVVDDEEWQSKLNVVLETSDLDEIIRYVTQHNEKEIEYLLKCAREIYNEYLDFSEWMCERNNKEE